MNFSFMVIDAPGYCDNRAQVYSRHKTLSAARRALRQHWVHPPGNQRSMSACIVERGTNLTEHYGFWDGLRAAQYPIHGID